MFKQRDDRCALVVFIDGICVVLIVGPVHQDSCVNSVLDKTPANVDVLPYNRTVANVKTFSPSAGNCVLCLANISMLTC